jgi:hypothetical protein
VPGGVCGLYREGRRGQTGLDVGPAESRMRKRKSEGGSPVASGYPPSLMTNASPQGAGSGLCDRAGWAMAEGTGHPNYTSQAMAVKRTGWCGSSPSTGSPPQSSEWASDSLRFTAREAAKELGPGVFPICQLDFACTRTGDSVTCPAAVRPGTGPK